MQIRKGKLKDAKAILNLLLNSPEVQAMKKKEEQSVYTKELVEAFIQDKKMNLVLVTEDKKEIIGVILAEIWLEKGYSFLSDMVISKEKRDFGIGSKLYGAYEKICKKRKLNSIVCLVQKKNKIMQDFCQRYVLKRGNEFYYYQKQI